MVARDFKEKERLVHHELMSKKEYLGIVSSPDHDDEAS